MVLCFVPAMVSGQEERKPVEGIIIKVTKERLIIDIGQEQGVPEGGVLVEVYERVEVVHPLTKKAIVDRFPLGTLPLEQVGSRMSIANATEPLSRQPRVGDFVVWRPPPPKKPEPVKEVPDPVEVEPVVVEVKPPPDKQALEETFEAALGKPIDERVVLWEAFLKAFPESDYTRAASEELVWLRGRLAEDRRALEAPPTKEEEAAPKGPGPLAVHVTAPRRLLTDDPLDIVIAVTEPERVQSVRLLTRRPNEPTFKKHPMTRDGDFFWRLELDGVEHDPGELLYFVEVIREDGQLRPISGDAAHPKKISISAPTPDKVDRQGLSRATASVDFVDFKLGAGEDRFVRFESDFRYLLKLKQLHAFRVGVGIFDGVGGSVEEVEQGNTSHLVTNYGFLETEFQLHAFFGFQIRALLGNQSAQGEDDRLDEVFGFRTQIRIGKENQTRMLLGGALTEGIGNQAWLELIIESIEKVPMRASVHVTNLPVGEDLGVSLNYGLGYRWADWFALLARVGWNARTINHTGLTLGLGTELTW